MDKKLLLDEVSRERLVKARKRFGLTQLQVAEACGVTQVMISLCEAGKSQPSLDLLDRWAAQVGLKLRVELRRHPGRT